ncbi:MAG: hypothetical protein KGO02_03560 [Alphaproteobacteria bacterium]|nr:hypothetical protein [Alphaproteobacteria bacterium]
MKLDRAIRLYALAVLANLLVFSSVALYLGGDAINGYAKTGHYFLCLYGKCHEVSVTLYRYSLWHALSVILSFALLLLLLGVQRWCANKQGVPRDRREASGH